MVSRFLIASRLAVVLLVLGSRDGFASPRAASASPYPAAAHALHTTLTELSIDAAQGRVHATVRAFADDLAAAPGHRQDFQAYVLSVFSLVDRTGRAVPLRGCGVRRTNDLVWVCVEAVERDMRGLSLRNRVLCEVFPDQVNIVRVGSGSAAKTMLFTGRDREKPLT